MPIGLLELASVATTSGSVPWINANKVTTIGKPIRRLEAALLRVAAGVTGALAGR
jgi:hypothetical protein